MRPSIIVDANPIVSALIGGFSRGILFGHHFEFITTEFTLSEVEKYIPYISTKSGVSIGTIHFLLTLIPLKIVAKEKYSNYIPKATSLVKDKKNIDILALALALGIPLWSNDKHFEGIIEIRLVKTKDFV